jgi:coproporphyrinogen III oxidase-like Fe-S oxidoreductase
MEPYLESLAGPEPRFPIGGSELLDERAAATERIILALRTDAGIPTAWAADPRFTPDIDWALGAGLLEPWTAPDGNRLRLTLRGNLLSNELFARLV